MNAQKMLILSLICVYIIIISVYIDINSSIYITLIASLTV